MSTLTWRDISDAAFALRAELHESRRLLVEVREFLSADKVAQWETDDAKKQAEVDRFEAAARDAVRGGDAEFRLVPCESAAPAGDGVTIGEFMGPLAAKFGEAAAPAGGGGELPELPEPDARDWNGRGEWFTAEQMRDYGQQCRLASTDEGNTQAVEVECRECNECGHVGINDGHATDAACHSCSWSGPSPAEDKCPGCGDTNCMGAACPDCSSFYRLIASTELPATGGGGEEPAEPWRPINELPNSDDLFWFRRGAAIDGPRVSQPSGLDADEWDYFAPCEAPSIRRLASTGSAPNLDAMVDRFLAWRLPDDFAPDAGISFTPNPQFPHAWPTGTNLLTAVQARAMFAHCVGGGGPNADARDAARYRFLRAPDNAIVYAKHPEAWGLCSPPRSGHVRYDKPEDLDTAIDEAMSATPTQEQPENGIGSNTGHGHVWARPDGAKARCGGPALCHQCREDAARYLPPPTQEQRHADQ